MKFLHAADIHLDSPLDGALRASGAPADLLAGCTRRALANLVDLALEQDVAFVVIAGDLYDGDWRDWNTGVFFAQQMRRLGDRRVFVVLGNHDAESVITKGLKLGLPANVHLLGLRHCETRVLDALGAAVHGQSFANRHVPDDMSAGYCPPVPGLLNIGLLHTSASDTTYARYAPCTPQALAGRGYAYWALGHVHAHAVLHEAPYVVFSGNTQGRHVREAGAKGCTLVEVQDRAVVHLEHRATDVLRWANVEVDADGVELRDALLRRSAEHVADAAGAADGRDLMLRLTLRGESPLHDALVADHGLAEADIRVALPSRVWLERLVVRTAPPRRPSGSADAMLRAFDEAANDLELRTELQRDIAGLLGRFPHDGAEDEMRALGEPEGLARLLAEARSLVLCRLGGGGAT